MKIVALQTLLKLERWRQYEYVYERHNGDPMPKVRLIRSAQQWLTARTKLSVNARTAQG
jgi:hypothetical protein